MSTSPNNTMAGMSQHSITWQRLHSEREDVSEALLKESATRNPRMGMNAPPSGKVGSERWHRELLEARLRKIDNALDRLLSGSYGSCSKCGRWIEDTKLESDPAIAYCLDCWDRMQRH